MDIKRTVIALACGSAFITAAAVGAGAIATDHTHDHTPPSEIVNDHGGGLDQCGGHYNRTTGQYHYHKAARC